MPAGRSHYIDDTDVETDNRGRTTTDLMYKDNHCDIYSVDTRFALWLVENALENADEPEEVYRAHIDALMALLNKEE